MNHPTEVEAQPLRYSLENVERSTTAVLFFGSAVSFATEHLTTGELPISAQIARAGVMVGIFVGDYIKQTLQGDNLIQYDGPASQQPPMPLPKPETVADSDTFWNRVRFPHKVFANAVGAITLTTTAASEVLFAANDHLAKGTAFNAPTAALGGLFLWGANRRRNHRQQSSSLVAL